MHLFYGVAVLIILIGLGLWAKNPKGVEWWWCAISAALAMIMAGLFHYLAIQAQCRDHETFSGRVVSATYHPWWQAREKVDDYSTDSKGNRHKTGSHYEYTDHPEYWDCEASYGRYISPETYKISKEFFNDICKNFCDNGLRTETPYKSDFYKGDRNIYVADNKRGYWYPTTTSVSFENRVKAGPSLYSFSPVPKDAPVFPYPASSDPFKSNRLLGTAGKTIPIRDFDIMNGNLGPAKKVNVILVGFGDKGSDIAQLQQAAWVGGKKNDLVICYGGKDPIHPSWVFTFGWTDKNLVKANLNTLLMKNPVDVSILPLIGAEVSRNYQIKEWRDFDYLEVEPPDWSYWVYFIVVGLVQGGLWWFLIYQRNDLTF